MEKLNIKEYYKVNFNDCGFYAPSHEESLVEWKNISRIALVFKIDDVALECSYFWAFQSNDPLNTFWVHIKNFPDDFSQEIKKRYGEPKIPHESQWNNIGDKIKSYVIWPLDELGKSMYSGAKKHWWTLGTRIVYS
jgi:hypothetical protein